MVIFKAVLRLKVATDGLILVIFKAALRLKVATDGLVLVFSEVNKREFELIREVNLRVSRGL